MNTKDDTFPQKYGPWAIVAGGSEGLGAAFAATLAKKGLNLVLIARRKEPLDALSAELRRAHAIEVHAIQADLSRPETAEEINAATADLPLGLFIYNAVLSNTGPFLSYPEEKHLELLRTNCVTPLSLVHRFAGRLKDRGKGGIVLMSSMSGLWGSPFVAHYAATKAYNTVLAESLWYELKPFGVDVITSCPGPIDTPGWRESLHGKKAHAFPPVARPDRVAEQTLKALGRRPLVVPGAVQNMLVFLTGRLLPRKTAVNMTGKTTRSMYMQVAHKTDGG
jgi:hypothetical protein